MGDAGQLSADYLKGGITLRCGQDEEQFDVSALVPTLPTMLADWLHAVHQKQAPPVTVQDGLATLQVVDACYRSDANGAEILLS